VPDAVALTPDLARDLIAMRAAWKSGTLDPSRVQQRPMRRRDGPQRWLPVKNTLAETIPPYSVCQLVDTIPEPDSELGYYLTVDENTNSGSGIYLFTGSEEIAYNGFGIATVDTPTWCRYYDDGSNVPVIGGPMGIASGGEWALEPWEDTRFNRKTIFAAWSEGQDVVSNYGRVLIHRQVDTACGGFQGASTGPYSSFPTTIDFDSLSWVQAGVDDADPEELEIFYPGVYAVHINITGIGGLGAGDFVEVELEVNGSDPSNTEIKGRYESPVVDSGVVLSGHEVSLSPSGLVRLDASDLLTVEIDSDASSLTIDSTSGFWVQRMQ
jgi:hypothetical protein